MWNQDLLRDRHVFIWQRHHSPSLFLHFHIHFLVGYEYYLLFFACKSNPGVRMRNVLMFSTKLRRQLIRDLKSLKTLQKYSVASYKGFRRDETCWASSHSTSFIEEFLLSFDNAYYAILLKAVFLFCVTQYHMQ